MLIAVAKILHQSTKATDGLRARESIYDHRDAEGNLCCDFVLWWTHLFRAYVLRIFLLVIMFNFFLLVMIYTAFDFLANVSKYKVCVYVCVMARSGDLL
jgi:hypothetical protein